MLIKHLKSSPVFRYSGRSEQLTSLEFKWSKTVCSSNGLLFKPCFEQRTNTVGARIPNMFGFWMVAGIQNSNGIRNSNGRPCLLFFVSLGRFLNTYNFSFHIKRLRLTTKWPPFCLFGFRMVRTIGKPNFLPFKHRTFLRSDFECRSDFRGWFSSPHCSSLFKW